MTSSILVSSFFRSLYLLKSWFTGPISFVYLIFLLWACSKFFWNISSLILRSFLSCFRSLYFFCTSMGFFRLYFFMVESTEALISWGVRNCWRESSLLSSSGLRMRLEEGDWFWFWLLVVEMALVWELALCWEVERGYPCTLMKLLLIAVLVYAFYYA